LAGIGAVEVFEDLRSHEHSCEIFASIFALAVLRKKLNGEQSAWSLIESKCLKWLGSQGIDAEPLISRAMALIP
jgi:hypothetical protein